MNRVVFFLATFLLGCLAIAGQVTDEEAIREAEKALKESENQTYHANKKLIQNDFVSAEGEYRKAISKSAQNAVAPYNLGRAYYNRESYIEAFSRFKSAGETAKEKPEKHKSYHNLGNVFMKRKEYQQAVEAYKQALRANPNDDETRYNLALAKKMLEKDKENEDKDDKDQNKDENQDNKDKDQNQDQNKEGDNDKKDEGDKDNKEGDKGDEGNEKPEDNKEGDDGEKKNEEKQQPKPEGEEKEEDKSPRPNELSEQQIQNLLEAMQNEEKKVQQKLNAQKVRGTKIKNEKDW